MLLVLLICTAIILITCNKQVPWSKLPILRSLASESYDTLAYHTSWLLVHWKFISQPCMGPQSRVVRDYDTFKQGRSLMRKIKAHNNTAEKKQKN